MRNHISFYTPPEVPLTRKFSGTISHWLALNAIVRGLCKQVHYNFSLQEGNISVAEHQGAYSMFARAVFLKLHHVNEPTRELFKMQILVQQFGSGLRVSICHKFPGNVC